MTVWHAFIDEGYKDEGSFCLGTVFAPNYICDEIRESLLARIATENARLALGGFPPIRRYHATDCAGFYKEFSQKRGWDHDRQISLTKRICNILIEDRACAMVLGGAFADLRPHLDPSEDEMKFWYVLCFKMLIHCLTAMIEKRYPDDGLVIFYDESPRFRGLAKKAQTDFVKGTTTASRRRHLLDCKPTNWRKNPELQLADYVTLQGLWRIDDSAKGKNRVKKSLAALIGNMPIGIERFHEQNFVDLIRMNENVKSGRPIDDGVDSKLMVLAS